MRVLLALLSAVLLTACAATPPTRGTDEQVAALARSIRALSPTVDPAEAARAAQLAYRSSYELAQAYGITDPPLIHNAKVNAGTRPRGLCYHWAEDMQARLTAAGFTTLEVTRAIATAQSLQLIDHSTAVIVAKGDAMEDGIILDPWRKGGRLFWSPVRADARYDWQPRESVLRSRGQVRYVQRTAGSLAPPPAE